MPCAQPPSPRFWRAPSPPPAAYSKAAEFLIAEQIRNGCESAAGRFGPGSVVERDLTGDGKADLIIDHGGLACAGGLGRSGLCGIRACNVFIYVREGALLVEKADWPSIGVTVGKGSPPAIGLVGHNFEASTVRWTGRGFK